MNISLKTLQLLHPDSSYYPQLYDVPNTSQSPYPRIPVNQLALEGFANNNHPQQRHPQGTVYSHLFFKHSAFKPHSISTSNFYNLTLLSNHTQSPLQTSTIISLMTNTIKLPILPCHHGTGCQWHSQTFLTPYMCVWADSHALDGFHGSHCLHPWHTHLPTRPCKLYVIGYSYIICNGPCHLHWFYCKTWKKNSTNDKNYK